MKIQFIKDCGHRPAGLILECDPGPASQYMAGGFAEFYIEPKPEPEPVAKEFPLSKKITDTLLDAGYGSILDIYDASDEELLAIKGIGKAAVKAIREIE